MTGAVVLNDADRLKVLDAARALFRRRGVHGTSLREIAEAADVPRGSMAHYFPNGKQQLVIEVVRYSSRELAEGVEAAFAGGADATTVLRVTTAMVGAVLERSGWWEGSPMATIALELSSDDEAIREACLSGYARVERAVADGFHGAGIPRDRSIELASLVAHAVDGALLRARLSRSLEPLQTTARELGRLVDAALSTPSQM